MNYQDIITQEKGKRGNLPCIRGLRVTVYDVLEYLISMPPQLIVSDFGCLTLEDIQACKAYEAEYGWLPVREISTLNKEQRELIYRRSLENIHASDEADWNETHSVIRKPISILEPIKLLFDKNLSPKLLTELSDIYPKSVHVDSLGLGNATDCVVWEYAKLHNHVFVSKGMSGYFYEMSFLQKECPKFIWFYDRLYCTKRIEFCLRNGLERIKRLIATPDLNSRFLV